MPRRPALDRGGSGESRVRVDRHRIADQRKQGRIEVAVAVGVAAIETNAVLSRPCFNRVGLRRAPHERSVEFTGVVRSVVGPRCSDDGVEPEFIGQRCGEGEW